jgi:hypothetical protein
MPPSQPDRVRNARQGIERDIAFEQFVSQGLSVRAAEGAAELHQKS